MKKVLSIGLGVLLAIGLALPVAADEGGKGLASVLEELYSTVAGWLADLESLPLEGSESGSSAAENPASSAGTSSGPGEAAEMTPMIWPGG